MTYQTSDLRNFESKDQRWEPRIYSTSPGFLSGVPDSLKSDYVHVFTVVSPVGDSTDPWFLRPPGYREGRGSSIVVNESMVKIAMVEGGTFPPSSVSIDFRVVNGCRFVSNFSDIFTNLR